MDRISKNQNELADLKDLVGCCGIKLFAGSSTGNLLVQQEEDIEKVFDIPNACYIFEIKLDILPNNKKIKFQPLSRFPSVKRDLAVVVKDDISSQDVLDCVFKTSCNYLNDVKIFDVYSGKGVDLGSKSIAVNFSFRSDEKTLMDEDINSDINLIINNLKKDINAQLRD